MNVTSSNLADSVHGIGPVLADRVIDQFTLTRRPRLWQSLDNRGPAPQSLLDLAPRMQVVHGSYCRASQDDWYSIPPISRVREARDKLQLQNGEPMILNNELHTRRPWGGKKAIQAWNEQLAVYRTVFPRSPILLFGPPTTLIHVNNDPPVRLYSTRGYARMLSQLLYDGLAPQWYFGRTTWHQSLGDRMELYADKCASLNTRIVACLHGQAVGNVPSKGQLVRPDVMARVAEIAFARGFDVVQWAPRADEPEVISGYAAQMQAIESVRPGTPTEVTLPNEADALTRGGRQ